MPSGDNLTKLKVLTNIVQCLIGLLLFSVSFFVLYSVVSSHSLFHDEAVYLTKARSWVEEMPADEFKIYRPIGMATLGWLLLHFDLSEKEIRMVGVFFGALALLSVYLLFKRVANTTVAIVVASIVGTSTLFLKQAPQFLNDIPSSALLFLVLLFIYIYYETAGKSKLIYIVPILAAIAFYIRYGSISSLGIIGILAIVILLPAFTKFENADYEKIKIACGIFAILFLPHIIYSYLELGSLSGILAVSGKAAGREYLGEGLINYILWLPSELGGPVLGFTAITGFIATAVIVLRENLRKKYIGLAWIGSIGISNFILTGLLVHAESRYVFFPVILLSGVGVGASYYLVSYYSKILPFVLMAIVFFTALYGGFVNYRETERFFDRRSVDYYNASYVEASKIILEDSRVLSGGSCVVWSVLFRPAVSWYSRCNTAEINTQSSFKKLVVENPGKSYYSIFFTKLTDLQIDVERARSYGFIPVEIFRSKTLSDSIGQLVVYRLDSENNQKFDLGRDWLIPDNY